MNYSIPQIDRVPPLGPQNISSDRADVMWYYEQRMVGGWCSCAGAMPYWYKQVRRTERYGTVGYSTVGAVSCRTPKDNLLHVVCGHH